MNEIEKRIDAAAPAAFEVYSIDWDMNGSRLCVSLKTPWGLVALDGTPIPFDMETEGRLRGLTGRLSWPCGPVT